jgi:hypothetical protein
MESEVTALLPTLPARRSFSVGGSFDSFDTANFFMDDTKSQYPKPDPKASSFL